MFRRDVQAASLYMQMHLASDGRPKSGMWVENVLIRHLKYEFCLRDECLHDPCTLHQRFHPAQGCAHLKVGVIVHWKYVSHIKRWLFQPTGIDPRAGQWLS